MRAREIDRPGDHGWMEVSGAHASTSRRNAPTAAAVTDADEDVHAGDRGTGAPARLGLVVTKAVTFANPRARRAASRTATAEADAPGRGRVPRLARLMALAIRFDALLRDGAVSSQTELARVGHVTRARVTQIMNLLWLAPDIQEEILFWPEINRGRDPITEHELRGVAAILDWNEQRAMWKKLAADRLCG